MKKAFTHLLMILIIMPSLACAMPMRTEGAAPVQQGTNAHCGDSNQVVTAAVAPDNTVPVMLYADCMGVELPPASGLASILIADWDLDADMDALGPASLREHHAVGRPVIIRGSAPPGVVRSDIPPIYLLTNRFRI